MNTLKNLIASVQAALIRIWPWTISKTSTTPSAPSWCEVVTDFGDRNLEILEGPLLGVIFRPTKFGFIPTEDDGVRIEFNYDFIHTAGLTVEELTNEENKNTIVRVIAQYYELGKNIE